MNKKVLAIDMDDVITINGVRRLINEYLGTSYENADFKDFYMQNIVPDKEAFFKFFMTKNLYDYCDITEGAIEVIEELNKVYDVYITTSFIFNEILDESGIIVKYKYDFLRKHFPFLDPYKLVFLGNKSILNVDVQIDDRIDNLYAKETNILFNAYHNTDISSKELEDKKVIRCTSWYEIKDKLLK